MGYRHELHIAAHALRDILEVALVVLRKKDFFVTGTVGSQRFLLEPANRQDSTAQRNLTRHCHVFRYIAFGQCGDQRSSNGDPCRGAILRYCTFRDVNVNIVFLMKIRL
ncbi:hypothetical protein D3C71_1865070 [compost metagenome]